MSIYKQLAIALAISVLGIYGTLQWYEHSQQQLFRSESSGAQVGWLKNANTTVERRMVSQRIWQPVSVGAGLHTGEAIRVPSDGTGQIELNINGTVINLDPDSLIVLEESKGRMELNLVSGSLFVKQSSSKATNSKSCMPPKRLDLWIYKQISPDFPKKSIRRVPPKFITEVLQLTI